jgi:tetratricopeptide (TPR) repeat protein
VYWYYGNQQIILENYNPAIKLYEKGLKWNPWQGEMYYDIGNILANKGINKTALEYFHKAEKYVDHHKLPQNIAITYLKLGDIKAAIPYLEKTIKYQSDKEEMLPFQLELGNIYLLQKDYSNAERLFKEIITNNPDNFETYYVLAGLYINQGKREQAIKALEKVIEIAPESKEAGYAKTTLTKLEQEK